MVTWRGGQTFSAVVDYCFDLCNKDEPLYSYFLWRKLDLVMKNGVLLKFTCARYLFVHTRYVFGAGVNF